MGTPRWLTKYIKRTISPALIISLLLILPASSGAITLETGEPEIKRSNLVSGGAVLNIYGRVDRGSEVIIKAVSPAKTVTYRTGEGPIVTAVIKVKGLPEVYKVLSSREITGLDKELKHMAGINGFQGLTLDGRAYSREDGRDRPMSPQEEKRYVEMTIKDRMYSGSYGVYEQGIKINGDAYSAAVWLGGCTEDIEITAYSINSGSITGTVTKKVSIPYSVLYGSPLDILLLSSISLCGGCFLVTGFRELKINLANKQKTV